MLASQINLISARGMMVALFALIAFCASGCDRFKAEEKTPTSTERLLVISKQYNEITFALGAQQNVVGVDLSSTFPPEIKKLPTVGYHRALSIEAILAMKPSLVLHDNNIGPDHVVKQLEDLKIPMKVFDTKAEDIDSLQQLTLEMGQYFHQEARAKEINQRLAADMQVALDRNQSFKDKPKVLVIHFGRASNVYLVMTKKNVAGKMIAWAGGEMAVEDVKGMKQLSAEVIAAADPDIILVTDYGYDQLGSIQKIIELPGVAATRAAKSERIYRVEESDLAYLGPRTGKNVQALQQLIHSTK